VQPVGVQHTKRGLHSLTIDNFRNIESAALSFGNGLNLVHGANGSGKTSLLEAIYSLGRVRSFRTHQTSQPIRYGQSCYRLVGHIYGHAGQPVPLGIERSGSALTVHFNGEAVRRLSDLAGNFPVQVLSSDTSNILTAGPRYRRQAIDWALFHVEQDYRELWQRYSRTLRQRNAALRNQAAPRLVSIWDEELVDAANGIDHLRRRYLDDFIVLFRKELDMLLPGMELTLRYLPGWPANHSLTEALAASLDKDRSYGATQQGVHRSDFCLLLNQHEVSGHCSRGQQKALLVAFLLAQVRLQQARQTPLGSFLLDDLSSELDDAAQQRVLEALRESGAQVFVSQITEHGVDPAGWSDYREFHVKHGVVNEVI
jgi:DNA replication and repair protein RecF